jgi:hypothetical protein
VRINLGFPASFSFFRINVGNAGKRRKCFDDSRNALLFLDIISGRALLVVGLLNVIEYPCKIVRVNYPQAADFCSSQNWYFRKASHYPYQGAPDLPRLRKTK